jgi:uncharacterized phage protein gp47/JayE
MKPIPTIEEIFNRIEQDLKTKLNLNDSELRTVLDAVCSALAGQIKLLYLFQGDIQNNLFPDTADLAENGGELNRLGLIYLNRQPKPATDGRYKIKFTGIPGSIVRAGITFKSNDESLNSGKLFIMDSQYEILPGINNIVEIRSIESGLENALSVGNFLVITEPVIGVEQIVEVVEIIELPIESESIDDYRKAIIDAIQLEPQGGARTDYRLWAQDAQGVRAVYPFVKENEAGVVQIFVEATEIDSTDGHGTPSVFILDDVKQVLEFDPDSTKPIEERGRRPIQAILEVLPITLRPVDVDVIDLNQNSTSIQNLIRTNLEDYLKSVRPFLDGADLARNKNDILNIARLQGVVSDSLGNTNYFMNFKMYVDGQEENLFIFSRSNIPYLRNVNYS